MVDGHENSLGGENTARRSQPAAAATADHTHHQTYAIELRNPAAISA